jgi:putative membrane protein
MPMAVINWLKLIHLLTIMLAVGGAIAQLLILAKYRRAGTTEAEVSEKLNLVIVRSLLFPSLMTAFVLGLVLAILTDRFSEAWIHAKLTLALIWVVLAHMQLRGAKRMISLRAAGDIAALEKTKGVQLNLSRVVSALLIIIVYLAVFKLDAF